MLCRKKERQHQTGKSNRRNVRGGSEYEDSISMPLSYRKNKDKNERKNVLKNRTKEKIPLKCDPDEKENVKITIIKSYSDEENHRMTNLRRSMFLDEQSVYPERLQAFNVHKHEKKCETSKLVELKHKMNYNEMTYVKGSPCRFKKNERKKKIEFVKSDENEKNTSKAKEYNIDGLWDYLNTVQHAGDDRMQHILHEIIDNKYVKDQDKHGEVDQNESNEQKKDLQKENKLNYKDYEKIVQFVLPSISSHKIEKSWNVLKKEIPNCNEEIYCKDLFDFVNKKDGEESDFVTKIVCSKLKNKIFNFNYDPKDVHLKTINYVDFIRNRATEFTRTFKEVVSEEEIKKLFVNKDNVKRDELEKQMKELIKNKLKNEKREDEQEDNLATKDKDHLNIKENNGHNRTEQSLSEFNMKAYISTLFTNKNDEISINHFIKNLDIDYDLLNSKNINIQDAHDRYTRPMPPTEIKDLSYKNELNIDEIKRAKFLIEEIDFSLRNNVKSIYIDTQKNKEIKDSHLSIYEIFKHLDVDKDSYITEEDLGKCMNKLRIKDMKPTDVNLLLKYMDSERNGYVHINDFLKNYNMEEKTMRKWIKNTNKPYYDFVKGLKMKGREERSSSVDTNLLNNKNASKAQKFDDVIYNYNLELDPYCPSYVIRERIRENHMANKEDFINKHLKATRFHITGYKNTNHLTEPVQNSALYIDDTTRFKTTYNLTYN